MPHRRLPATALAGLALLSAVTLGFEVFVTRAVAYSLPVMLVYVVLGVALLGFGAAGSVVSLRRGWLSPERLPRALAGWALAFVATLVVSVALFARLTPYVTDAGALALAVSAILSLPFFACGVVVALALAAAGDRVGRAYAANLAGSGLGCFLPLVLLGPLSGPRFAGFLALLGWVAAMLFVLAARPRLRSRLAAGALAALAVAGVSLAAAPRLFDFAPETGAEVERTRKVARQMGVTLVRLYDRWNPVGRVEIFAFAGVPGWSRPYPFLFWAQDSGAPSTLIRWDGRTRAQIEEGGDPADAVWVADMCSSTLYGQGYFAPRKRVLVIGVGGGPDVQCALFHGAARVDAVDINPDVVAAIQGPFNRFLGGIGRNPRVRFHLRDGRSFIHANDGPFDLIELTGTDDKSSLSSSSSLALAENRLYSVDAFHDYLRLLAPRGVLSILRFHERAALRLANMAVTALVDMGVRRPAAHVALTRDDTFHGILVRRTPFSPGEARALAAHIHRPSTRAPGKYDSLRKRFPHVADRRVVLYAPGVASEGAAGAFFQAVRAGDTYDFEEAYPFDISPVDDDRPFFFDQIRYDRPGWWNAPHVKAVTYVLASVLLLSLIFVLLPIWSIGRGARGRGKGVALLFFAGVGLGYLLVEVWLVHRFAGFLGHQTYGLSVVLAVLLVSTGVGARVGERLLPEPRRRILVGLGGIGLLLLAGFTVVPPLMDWAWGGSVWVRGLVASLFIAPLGLFMGLPFPGGLRWAAGALPAALAWCIGVNGFASVLATVAVVPAAHGLGYEAVALLGAGSYALALLALPGMKGRAAAPAPPAAASDAVAPEPPRPRA